MRRLSWLMLLCSACGQDRASGPPPGLVHLDPRLADGRASVEVLGAQRELVREWRGGTATADLEPWELLNATLAPVEGWSGEVLRLKEYDPSARRNVIQLALRETLEASTVDVVELDVEVHSACEAHLTWRARGSRTSERMMVGVAPADSVQTLRFFVGARPAWHGTIEHLVLQPVHGAAPVLRLAAIRFLTQGCALGAEPGASDAGLLGFDGDLRRVWPARPGEPLFDRVRVRAGGRLVVSTALPGALHALDGEARFALDVRVDGSWETRAERASTPATEPGPARWQPLSADLSDLAGREVDLRFRAELSGTPPPRATCWWGSPLVAGERGSDPRPDLLLVTLDTTRADALDLSAGGRTPFLASVAREGVLFEDAWTTCNHTLPAHTSILTGMHVPTHGVLDNRAHLAPGVRTVTEALRDAGYRTAAAVSVRHLDAGTSGLGRGFDRFLDVRPGAQLDGSVTVDVVLEWLAEWDEHGRGPTFLWLHLFDAHIPYGGPTPFETLPDPPPRTTTGPAIGDALATRPGRFLAGVTNPAYARHLYHAGVAHADAQLARLIGDWQRRFGPHALIVTADHGEALGEDEHWFNHSALHTPTLNVPLIVRLPGGPAGQRSTRRASVIDVAATLLGLGRAELPGALGEDLSLAAPGPEEERRVWFVRDGLHAVGFHDGGGPRVFASAEEGDSSAEARLARGWLERASTGRRVGRALTREEERELGALGYGGEEEGER